jgi:methylenetetrahydrofolate reductase (NADPH)
MELKRMATTKTDPQEQKKNTGSGFKEAMTRSRRFVYTVELVPGRGSYSETIEQVLEIAKRAAAGGRIHALSITDNAGGRPALAPEAIGLEVLQFGIDPIIHFTCKDKSRNQIESALYALDRVGLRNILALTGDYPLSGFQGESKPVFDLDSVQLLQLMSRMNAGLEIDATVSEVRTNIPPLTLFKGCAVSPFKQLESETILQYFKLLKKFRAGADFAITQVGYDVRKLDELLRFMRSHKIEMPVIGNVFVLNLGTARAMNRKAIPGCVVTNALMEQLERESHQPDKGKAARLLRAAKLIAVLRGLGYSGAHIGGPNLKYEDVEWIIVTSEELAPRWREYVQEFSFPQENGYYLFQKDDETGLNSDVPSIRTNHTGRAPGYAFMRFFHRYVFDWEAPLCGTARAFCKALEDTRLEELFGDLEHLIKFITSRCQKCGDCTLSDIAFLCPQSQCAKYLLNGPCGGSSEGWCEMSPKKRRCIYVKAYERLKSYGEEESLKETYVPPRDWQLNRSSSWANYFLGKDHSAKKHKEKP